MRVLGLLYLLSCLTIIVTQSAFALSSKCEEVFTLSSGPVGQLSAIQRYARTSTDGRWMSDENGINWFVKKDVYKSHSELQSSAEPIASQIYRHFGYRTPDTFKLIINGVHYSVSKDVGRNYTSTDFSGMDTSEIRQMRVVAAYLKDWDRLGNPANNLILEDGSLVILDFGGTLGSRAQGQHKADGPIFSDAIGSFEATHDINVIYSSFKVKAYHDHPWMKINRLDALAVIQKFKLLSDKKIESIVESAQYSRSADRDYMIQALKIRRDGIILYLLSLFP